VRERGVCGDDGEGGDDVHKKKERNMMLCKEKRKRKKKQKKGGSRTVRGNRTRALTGMDGNSRAGEVFGHRCTGWVEKK